MRRGVTDLRLDVPFHKPSTVCYLQELVAHNAGVAKVREIAHKVVDGPFGTQLKVEEYQETGFPLIRVSDVRTGVVREDGLVFISQEKQKQLLRSQVLPGDVILTKAGAILGYSAVFPNHLVEGNITSHSVLIRCKDAIFPQFLSYYFRSKPGQVQIYRWGNKATRPELNTQEVKRIIVPLLYHEQQLAIIDVMRKGEEESKCLEEKSKDSLASIDDYLLDALGITLPPEPENTIENRMFLAKRRKLAGWRFDAKLHQTVFSLYTNKYPMHFLKQYAFINPKTFFSGITDGEMVSFVPMESVSDEDGTIVEIQTREAIGLAGYTRFKESDLLWAKITPCMENGKSAVAENLVNSYGYGSTEYHVFRPKNNDLDVYYLHALFRMKRLRKAATRYFSGSSGHQRVDDAFFKRLEIPIPPLEKQEEISLHVYAIREQAKNLRREAEQVLEQAKCRVEEILLSGSQE